MALIYFILGQGPGYSQATTTMAGVGALMAAGLAVPAPNPHHAALPRPPLGAPVECVCTGGLTGTPSDLTLFPDASN